MVDPSYVIVGGIGTVVTVLGGVWALVHPFITKANALEKWRGGIDAKIESLDQADKAWIEGLNRVLNKCDSIETQVQDMRVALARMSPNAKL